MERYERIAQIKAELNYLKLHRTMLEESEEHLEILRKQKEEKEKQLKKENKDVEKLEKSTIQSLFYSIVGTKQQQLEKERYEAMQASIEYHKINNDFQIQQESFLRLKERYAQEEKLYEELEQLVLEDESYDKEEILLCKHQYISLMSQLKEVKEAIAACKNAYDRTYQVLEKLKSAQNWGYYDIFGGDFLGTMMKHENLDQAQRMVQEASHAINIFQKELNDVEMVLPQFDTMTIVFDYVDNIFVDWIVQSQINKSVDQISHIHQSIQKAIQDLKQQKENLQKQSEETLQRLKKLLLVLN